MSRTISCGCCPARIVSESIAFIIPSHLYYCFHFQPTTHTASIPGSPKIDASVPFASARFLRRAKRVQVGVDSLLWIMSPIRTTIRRHCCSSSNRTAGREQSKRAPPPPLLEQLAGAPARVCQRPEQPDTAPSGEGTLVETLSRSPRARTTRTVRLLLDGVLHSLNT